MWPTTMFHSIYERDNLIQNRKYIKISSYYTELDPPSVIQAHALFPKPRPPKARQPIWYQQSQTGKIIDWQKEKK